MQRFLAPARRPVLAGLAGLTCLTVWSGAPPAVAQAGKGIPLPLVADACFSTNPYFATTAFAPPCSRCVPAVIAFHKGIEPGEHYTLATQGDVGSVYGLAFRDVEPYLYAAAYLKRGAPFGPGGPGQIYRIAIASGSVTPYVRVVNTGSDPHDRPSHWPDDGARDLVGKMGLGDMDIEQTGSDLFAMNLADRRIYHYRMSGPSLVGSFPMGAADEPWAADARPFALKIYRGRVYHGLVNSAESTQNPADLKAYVYRSNFDGTDMQQILAMPLVFERGRAVNAAPAQWLPWRSGFHSLNPPNEPAAYPQPILADIEFNLTGHMILGFRDRLGGHGLRRPARRHPGRGGAGCRRRRHRAHRRLAGARGPGVLRAGRRTGSGRRPRRPRRDRPRGPGAPAPAGRDGLQRPHALSQRFRWRRVVQRLEQQEHRPRGAICSGSGLRHLR